jgi:hypothetical protein
MIAMSSLCNSIWIEMMANTFPLMQIEVYETFILFTGNDFQSLVPLTAIFFFFLLRLLSARYFYSFRIN